jgi:hypothetical protein
MGLGHKERDVGLRYIAISETICSAETGWASDSSATSLTGARSKSDGRYLRMHVSRLLQVSRGLCVSACVCVRFRAKVGGGLVAGEEWGEQAKVGSYLTTWLQHDVV